MVQSSNSQKPPPDDTKLQVYRNGWATFIRSLRCFLAKLPLETTACPLWWAVFPLWHGPSLERRSHGMPCGGVCPGVMASLRRLASGPGLSPNSGVAQWF